MKRAVSVFALGVTLAVVFTVSACNTKKSDVTCKKKYGSGKTIMTLATGSPGELGLLEKLTAAFNAKNDTTLCWVKAGSGKSLKLLKAKKVNIVMVHAPGAEKQAVKDGWAVQRTLIGSNEFYIVGPKDDPAGIRKAKTAAEAYSMIAKAKAPFMSRGDNSGTNKKELAIWKKAGITPSGSWYIITKEFMMATLKRADREKGYFMTDSSTYVAGKKDLKNIDVLFKGDPVLINTYHALAGSRENNKLYDLSVQFIQFLSSPEGQKIITDYGKKRFGGAMYNNAKKAKKYDH